MMIYRRTLLASTMLTFVAGCSAQTASTLQADLAVGIQDASLIDQAAAQIEADIKADNPTLISASQDLEIKAGLGALNQAVANLTALGAVPVPSSAAAPLEQIITAFNGLAAVVNAILPPASAVDPKLQPVLIIFQSATLIVQTVLEPLLTQVAANQPKPALVLPLRLMAPAGMTLNQARAALRAAAQGRR